MAADGQGPMLSMTIGSVFQMWLQQCPGTIGEIQASFFQCAYSFVGIPVEFVDCDFIHDLHDVLQTAGFTNQQGTSCAKNVYTLVIIALQPCENRARDHIAGRPAFSR
jgi:hypothetical protein